MASMNKSPEAGKLHYRLIPQKIAEFTMANVSFFVPTNMASAQTWFGNLTQATSTRITITDGIHAGQYSGLFSYAGNNVFGTLTGYQEFEGTMLTKAVGGFAVDAHVAQTYIDSNQLQGLFKIALAGNDTITGSNGTDVLFGYDGDDLRAGLKNLNRTISGVSA